MIRRLVLGLLVGLLARPTFAVAGEAPAPAPAPASPADAAAAVETANGERDFAFDLHRQLTTKGGNVFASPFSISTALAMTTAGARGATSAELVKALHLPDGFGPKFRALAKSVASIPMIPEYDPETRRNVPRLPYRLSIANSIYSQRGWKFLDAFRRSVAEDYFAEFGELDFGKSEAARQTINEWVAKKTNDKIKDIVPPGLLTADTRMVLANAIWFRGTWDEEFKEHKTADGPFTTGLGKDIVVKTMHRVDTLSYTETPDAQILELPYKSREMSMVVILPKAKDGLVAVEKAVTGASFAAWMSGLQSKLVDVAMPKFELTSTLDLVSALKALGVQLAFSETASDFSGIVAPSPSVPSLFIGAILHKAFVAVDEHGTEAAAATVVGMFPTSAMPGGREPDPIPFHVDHPFLFAIRHIPSGAILFLGRVTDPTVPH